MTRQAEDVIEDYVCVWLDVLGTTERHRLLQFAKTCSSLSIDDRSEILNSRKAIGTLRKSVNDSFTWLSNINERASLAEQAMLAFDTPTTEEVAAAKHHFEQIASCEPTIHFIGDGVLLSLPVRRRDGSINLFPIIHLVGVCAIAHLISVGIGEPLRGGMAFGAACRMTEGDVFGPAVAAAHYAGERTADYARIVAHDSLVSMLTDLSEVAKKGVDPALPVLLELSNEQWKRDSDGQYCVDALRFCKQCDVTGQPLYNNCVSWIRRERERLQSPAVNCTEADKRFKRLQRLASLFDLKL